MQSDGSAGGVIDEERGPTFLQSIRALLPPALSQRLVAAVAVPFKPVLEAPAPPAATGSEQGGDEGEARRSLPPTPPPFSNKIVRSPPATRPWAALHTLALPAHYDVQIFHAPNDSLPELSKDAWKSLMRADAAAAAATTSAFLLICDARWRRPGLLQRLETLLPNAVKLVALVNENEFLPITDGCCGNSISSSPSPAPSSSTPSTPSASTAAAKAAADAVKIHVVAAGAGAGQGAAGPEHLVMSPSPASAEACALREGSVGIVMYSTEGAAGPPPEL